jgi:glycosyltransferase involved in cell wall biosynthesis
VRVLHVLRGDYATHVGGDLGQLRATAKALGDQGVRVETATMTEAQDEPDVVHLYNLQRPRPLAADVAIARRRWPEARIVISPVFWPWDLSTVVRVVDPAVWWRAAKSGAKARSGWLTCRRLLGQADAVLPNSLGEGERVRRYFALPPGPRWMTVPNGLWIDQWPMRADIDRPATLAAFGLDPSLETLVACVARVEPQKNQRALVEAVAAKPTIGLLLVGPWDTTRYGLAVRERLERDLPRRAACTGVLSQPDIGRLLAGVDVHVLASFRETPGLASLEAAAVGCEIVVTPGGSTLEYFGSDAHVASSGRALSIAEAIDDALRRPRQPDLRRRVDSYDWSRAATALRDAYDSALSAPPATAG